MFELLLFIYLFIIARGYSTSTLMMMMVMVSRFIFSGQMYKFFCIRWSAITFDRITLFGIPAQTYDFQRENHSQPTMIYTVHKFDHTFRVWYTVDWTICVIHEAFVISFEFNIFGFWSGALFYLNWSMCINHHFLKCTT